MKGMRELMKLQHQKGGAVEERMVMMRLMMAHERKVRVLEVMERVRGQ
jgi:hypothetical protein